MSSTQRYLVAEIEQGIISNPVGDIGPVHVTKAGIVTVSKKYACNPYFDEDTGTGVIE